MKPVQIFKKVPAAVEPTRGHETDAGLDISIIGVHTSFQHHKLYNTGLVIVFNDPMLYGRLYARSSLAKRGLALTNAVGIIDPSYRGELLVSLYSLFQPEGCPQIPFKDYPLRVCQLVIERRVLTNTLVCETRMWHEVEKEYLALSERGEGGFGSTGL
jgi:dUTP pyrophosphatase